MITRGHVSTPPCCGGQTKSPGVPRTTDLPGGITTFLRKPFQNSRTPSKSHQNPYVNQSHLHKDFDGISMGSVNFVRVFTKSIVTLSSGGVGRATGYPHLRNNHLGVTGSCRGGTQASLTRIFGNSCVYFVLITLFHRESAPT